MALDAHEPRVVGQLDDLDERAVRAGAAEHEAGRGQPLAVVVVHFVAVPVAFADRPGAEGGERFGARRQLALVGPEPHRPAELRDLALGVLQADDRVGRFLVELGRVGVGQAEDVAGVLDRRALEAEADAEERDAVLAGEVDRLDHARRAALVEPARYEQAIDVGQGLGRAVVLDLLGLEADDLHLGVVGDAGVVQCLVHALVGVAVLDVLADEGDRHLVLRVADAFEHRLPVVDVQRAGLGQVQLLDDDVVELVAVQADRHLVDTELAVLLLDHRPAFEVAKEGDFLAVGVRDFALGAANEHVRLDADLAQFHHAVLRRLGLQLAGRLQVRHQRQVDEQAVLLADFEGELADRLEVRHPLDVADRAADLGDDDIHFGRDEPADAPLDLVRDVRDDLDRLALVVAVALLVDDRQVNLAGREVAVAVQGRVGEPLVVAEVEVGLRAVVEDVDFAVLVGGHRPRIDVDVRVELLHPHRQPAPLQQEPDAGTRQPLAEGTDDAAGHENVLRHAERSLHANRCHAGEVRPNWEYTERPGGGQPPEPAGSRPGERLQAGDWVLRVDSTNAA